MDATWRVASMDDIRLKMQGDARGEDHKHPGSSRTNWDFDTDAGDAGDAGAELRNDFCWWAFLVRLDLKEVDEVAPY